MRASILTGVASPLNVPSAAPRLSHRRASRPCQYRRYIERESQNRTAAEAFVGQLTEFCEHLATLPGLMGRDRSELRLGYRSTVYGNYVIFLRYADDAGPRSHLYVVNVIHGARDMDAYFEAHPDDEA